MSEEKSVIRPSDIPVKAKKYTTVLSPVVSDLAASCLVEPLKMSVRPPVGSLVDFKFLHLLDTQEIKILREKVDRLLEKYK
jgi:hypothetical protein